MTRQRWQRRPVDVVTRLDRASEDVEQHRRSGHTVPAECALELSRAIVQLFAEGLVSGFLHYGGDEMANVTAERITVPRIRFEVSENLARTLSRLASERAEELAKALPVDSGRAETYMGGLQGLNEFVSLTRELLHATDGSAG